MKLTIIDKYIARELIFAFFSVLFVLLIIVLSTEVVHLLKWVSQGVIPLSAFLTYLINSLFEFGIILIPLSLLMGILMAFGRLYHDSEMAAIMSAGIGPMLPGDTVEVRIQGIGALRNRVVSDPPAPSPS